VSNLPTIERDYRALEGAVKPLVDEDRVEKIDNLYYPKT